MNGSMRTKGHDGSRPCLSCWTSNNPTPNPPANMLFVQSSSHKPRKLSTKNLLLFSNPNTKRSNLPITCWSAYRADALIHGRPLFEPGELGRPTLVRVSPIQCGRPGWKWFWVLLPKQKELGCRAETRLFQKQPTA